MKKLLENLVDSDRMCTFALGFKNYGIWRSW